jgi:hypothetical protein
MTKWYKLSEKEPRLHTDVLIKLKDKMAFNISYIVAYLDLDEYFHSISVIGRKTYIDKDFIECWQNIKEPKE